MAIEDAWVLSRCLQGADGVVPEHGVFRPRPQRAPRDALDALRGAVAGWDASESDRTEKTLAKQPYLLGDTFSVADGYLFNMLRWTEHTGIDRSKWPALVAFFDRVSERPAVKAALEAEKAVH